MKCAPTAIQNPSFRKERIRHAKNQTQEARAVLKSELTQAGAARDQIAQRVAIVNDAATAGATIIGQASTAGSLCLRVYDIGGIPSAVPYQVQVTHF